MKRVVGFLTLIVLPFWATGQTEPSSGNSEAPKAHGFSDQIEIKSETGNQKLDLVSTWREGLSAEEVARGVPPNTPFETTVFYPEGKKDLVNGVLRDLEGKGITPELVEVPEKMGWLQSRWIKPNAGEWTMGVTLGIASLAVRGSIWMAAGLEPTKIIGLTLAQSLVVAAVNINIQTFNKIMRTSFTDSSKEVSGAQNFIRRTAWEWIQLELWRIASGPIGTAHSAWSAEGQWEIGANLGLGTLGLLYYQLLSKLSRRAVVFGTLHYAAVAGLLVRLDFAGMRGDGIFQFGSITVYTAQAVIFGLSALMIGVIQLKPHWMENWARWNSTALEKSIGASKLLLRLGRMGRQPRNDSVTGFGTCKQMFAQ